MGLCQEISSSPLNARTLVTRCFESLVLDIVNFDQTPAHIPDPGEAAVEVDHADRESMDSRVPASAWKSGTH